MSIAHVRCSPDVPLVTSSNRIGSRYPTARNSGRRWIELNADYMMRPRPVRKETLLREGPSNTYYWLTVS